MRAEALLEALEFHDEHPFAQPLLVNEDARILRFTLKPGQSIDEHSAPHSPLYVVILQGKGAFAGKDGVDHEFSANTLLTFDAGEIHSVRALDEILVFVGFLQGVEPYYSPSAKVDEKLRAV